MTANDVPPILLRPVILVVVALSAGCAARSHVEPSTVEVYDFNGAAGYGNRAIFDGQSVSIVVTSDFGRPDEEVWARSLSQAERALLTQRIERLPLATMKDEYCDPRVWDGKQLTFDVHKRDGTARTIMIGNVFVEELAELTDALDAMIPFEYRVRYREWKEAITDLTGPPMEASASRP